MITSKGFAVLGFIFTSLIHFVLNFVYDISVPCYSFALDIQFSLHRMVRRVSFPRFVFLASFLKIS